MQASVFSAGSTSTSGDGKRSARRARIRAFNDDLAKATGADRRGVALLACECGGEGCSESLSVGYADYDAVRNHAGAGRFFVVVDHENGQRVLVENAHFALIEVGLDSEALSNGGDGYAAGAGPVRRVLVVDDDAATRMICAINLKAEGFSVIEASDGSEALELARSECPDLIVTDVDMPRRDGFELAEALRRDERTREIPLIFMSGQADETHRARALELGAIAFLAKPFDSETLATTALGALA
jgi:CheY-like chemotaxis protein